MKRHPPDLDLELEAFLAPRKVTRSVPPGIRARALARARRIIAAGGTISPALHSGGRDLERESIRRGRIVAWTVLAASVVLAAGTVGAVIAIHGRSDRPAPVEEMEQPLVQQNDELAEGLDNVQPVVDKHPPAAHPRRAVAERDLVADELALLQRAQTAYARQNCTRALLLLGEHARRFPQSRLAEERDALRVRSLGCAGRPDEERRAAAGFAARFPRSVLLPRGSDGERAVE